MNTLVPIEFYALCYFYFLLIIVGIVFVKSKISKLENTDNLKFLNFLGLFCLFLITLYIGFRPISGRYFGDMSTYAAAFSLYQNGMKVESAKDPLFEYFAKFCSSIMSVYMYFFVCAILYVFPLYSVSKKIFKEYWFYCFLLFVCSFSFWTYGTNGIRNGLATSLFLFAITRKNKIVIFAILLIVLSIHKALYIPVFAYFVSIYYKNTKTILIFWFLAIPLSLALGGFWESFFLQFGFGEDDRLTGYLSGNQEALDIAVKVGFRWDFLVYSASAVYAGWYYIFKKDFKDAFYNHLFNVYLMANGFWILVIRANFSNRFAYLSWFMMAIIIIYPLLKVKMFKNQNVVIGNIVLGYFIFTFIMNVVLSN